MSLKAFCVEPGSVNDYPPMEIQVCSLLLLAFSPVKRLYRDAPLASIDVISKLEESKKENAKLMCVKPSRFKSSGATFWHWRVLD